MQTRNEFPRCLLDVSEVNNKWKLWHKASNNYKWWWLTADWCCCVAVDLWSRVEMYQCGNDIRLSPSAAELLDEGEGLVNLGNVGDEEPVVVGADIGLGWRFVSFFLILRFSALRGLVLANFDFGILMLGLVASSHAFWCWDWWPAHVRWRQRVLLRVALQPAATACFAPQLVFIVPAEAASHHWFT